MAATGPKDSAALQLASAFPAAGHAAWRKLVDKILAGTDYDTKLVSRTYDGIAIQPLYTRADLPAHTAMPLRTVGGWDVRQTQGHPDPKIANTQILSDLERGAASIVLKIDGSGERGIAIRTLADLDTTLKGVLLDLAPVTLDVAGPPMPYAALLMHLLTKRGVKPSAYTGNFGFDPLALFAVSGKMPTGLDTVMARLSDGVATIAQHWPKARTLNVNTTAYHSAGCSEAQELACALATATDYLRAVTAKLPIDTAIAQIGFTLTADADFFLTVAKVRALRKLWAQVADSCGVSDHSAQITAVTAPRMMTRRDPWVNMLRATSACFAAGIAGADAVTVLPFDNALGLPSDLGRRIARNTQMVLQEEAGLAHVADPAAGSYMFEHLTDDLAQKSWALFQEIEKHGGMIAALTSGLISEKIQSVADARTADIAARKLPITGVTTFPDANEKPLKPVSAKAPPAPKPTAAIAVLPLAEGFLASAVKAAAAGADVAAIWQAAAVDRPATVGVPLPPAHRLAEPFETQS